jgi:hypothetical protein
MKSQYSAAEKDLLTWESGLSSKCHSLGLGFIQGFLSFSLFFPCFKLRPLCLELFIFDWWCRLCLFRGIFGGRRFTVSSVAGARTPPIVSSSVIAPIISSVVTSVISSVVPPIVSRVAAPAISITVPVPVAVSVTIAIPVVVP